MWINMQQFGCFTPVNKIMAETNNTVNFTVPLTTKVIVDYDTKKYSVEFDHMKQDKIDVFTLRYVNYTMVRQRKKCCIALSDRP